MPIHLGSGKVGSMYIGSTKVKEAYLGSAKVFGSVPLAFLTSMKYGSTASVPSGSVIDITALAAEEGGLGFAWVFSNVAVGVPSIDGWTTLWSGSMGGSGTAALFWKRLTPADTSVTLRSTSQHYTPCGMCFVQYEGAADPVAATDVSTVSQQAQGQMDPPVVATALDPANDQVICWMGQTQAATGATPTGYVNVRNGNLDSGLFLVGWRVSRKGNPVEFENPGTMGLSASLYWMAGTLVVRQG